MKTSTRLIVILAVIVGAVMTVGGYFILRQREAALESAMRHEVHAHALTLQIALEDLYRSGRRQEAQELIDSLSENPRVYGVVLFSPDGRVAMVSNPLVADEIKFAPEVRRVLTSGGTIETVHKIIDQEVFSIIMPINIRGKSRGAFEIAQPMSFIRADFARARREIIFVSLLLFSMIILAVVAVTRFSLLRPINELLRGAAALGRGDHGYRVAVPGIGSEFTSLASEFNRMADKLDEQRENAAREAERRLKLERELKHSERLASIGRLAAGIAHEIGTPLNVIDMRTEQITRDLNGVRERSHRNAMIIRAQVERITRIVRQLLTLARPYKLKNEPIDMTALISGTLELLETEAQSSRVFTEFHCSRPVMAHGDREYLQQVFTNIILNAIQSMPDGGLLRIEFNEGEPAEGRRILTVSISDTGIGIRPDDLPRIFEPFYTTKDVGSGTGLGLTVSHSIIEEHGGWIEAANNDEGGATFTIHLPQAQAAIDNQAPLPAGAPAALIVERRQTNE
ncbi:MAG: HAMP domain-containing protein [Blastocatellia bacterium]|nr:HAMP domain-containing protein [Blastocatellia bacterium]